MLKPRGRYRVEGYDVDDLVRIGSTNLRSALPAMVKTYEEDGLTVHVLDMVAEDYLDRADYTDDEEE